MGKDSLIFKGLVIASMIMSCSSEFMGDTNWTWWVLRGREWISGDKWRNGKPVMGYK